MEGKDFKAYDKGFIFVAAFINGSTENENTTSMISVLTRYNEIIADVTGNIRHRSWSGRKLRSLEKRVKEFKRM